jgi:hypothetical protein
VLGITLPNPLKVHKLQILHFNIIPSILVLAFLDALDLSIYVKFHFAGTTWSIILALQPTFVILIKLIQLNLA